MQFGQQGSIVDHSGAIDMSGVNLDRLAEERFAFINVWRSIDESNPVMEKPLAVCDERSIRAEDKLLYYLKFPDRTGENYSLKHSPRHKWYYYPLMEHDECLVFKVYDKVEEDCPRFVFHTAFEDTIADGMVAEDVPRRKSVEVRTIAFF